jgi:hypothetical protein
MVLSLTPRGNTFPLTHRATPNVASGSDDDIPSYHGWAAIRWFMFNWSVIQTAFVE